MPNYETNASQGYMGDWKRGAPLGRVDINLIKGRTPAQLEAEAADHDHEAALAECDKEKRLNSGGYKMEYWQAHADYERKKAAELRAMIPAAEKLQKEAQKVTLRRIKLDSSGYDQNGTYFGIGAPIYWAATEDGAYDATFRASDRAAAKEHVRKTFSPQAAFTN